MYNYYKDFWLIVENISSFNKKRGTTQYGQCLIGGNCIILNTNLQEKGTYEQVRLQRLDTLWLSDPFCVRNFWKKKTFTFNRLKTTKRDMKPQYL